MSCDLEKQFADRQKSKNAIDETASKVCVVGNSQEWLLDMYKKMLDHSENTNKSLNRNHDIWMTNLKNERIRSAEQYKVMATAYQNLTEAMNINTEAMEKQYSNS